MKHVFTLCLLLTASFWVKAQDMRTIGDGAAVTIESTTAPINILIKKGGKCIINSISDMTGKTITVELGGTLEVAPVSNDPIVINQDIIFEAFEFPARLDDANVFPTMLDLQQAKLSNFNIVNTGNYPKITFNGSIDLTPGTIFNIGYPATETKAKLEFAGLNMHAIAIPSDFTGLLKNLLSSKIPANYLNLLDLGVLPPVVAFESGSGFPTVNAMELGVKITSIEIEISDLNRGVIVTQYPALTIPSNETYFEKELDLGAYSRIAPASYSTTIDIAITTPTTDGAGDYTIVFPQLEPSADKEWFLYENDNKVGDVDLSSAISNERTFTTTLLTGENNGRFKFVREDIPSSLSQITGDYEIQSVEYFTVAGQKVQMPQNGLYIVKTTYTNGMKNIEKIIF